MIEVNVAALTALTALLLPGMLERHRGAILNAASTAAFQPGPNQAVYGATKACVLSFTEALAEEVRGSGVRVSCLAPGATDTGLAAQAGMAGTRLFRRGVIDAGRVAQAGRDGLQRGKTVIIPGLRNRVPAFSVRLSPRVPCHQGLWLPAGLDADQAARRSPRPTGRVRPQRTRHRHPRMASRASRRRPA